ncbi:NAD-dependent epimerase/dehydratase family protein [Pedobacter sp. MC2016-14]|uniref:polysaccharide biosynthesis C-terminal domain-containing protein n=1 Tax=Pedobacter sp. MC2016-14 TaxID=2897327 RepID=UPI001E3D37FD|nr:NAD-dependent epimerase/dehydratase family protein [Pedobacter sp. MC2016-14]MCD0486887.1 NAD-dependent epimerase/dehydratase family protein [Pedobacter sp. MC2016-14]
MIKIGITGQSGFIGQHLYNTLGLYPQEFERIEFKRSYFEDQQALTNFVAQCDVIVHLAAVNRHNDPNQIYNTNINLVTKLIDALNYTNSKAHVLFSSSSQEGLDNLYGKSKKEGREMLEQWAGATDAKLSGMLIPNVFGPFGQPYYNSFVATFCHQLTHNAQPVILNDSLVKLIYVGDVVNQILLLIRAGKESTQQAVFATEEKKVSEVLELLETYKTQYLMQGIIPALNSNFELNLFNTFRGYIDHGTHYPVAYTKHTDERGAFVEIIRLNAGGQVSFSTTVPGITRGNHYHTRKIERFAVIKGKALIQLRKIGGTEVLNFYLDGNSPAYVDMPIWFTHNIKNIGEEELLTNFWINEFYDPNDPDTYFETV